MSEKVDGQLQVIKETPITSLPIEREMRKLVQDGSYLDQDVVYQRLASVLPYEVITNKVGEDFGKSVAIPMVAQVREHLGEEYVRLLIEPSLSTRTDDFVAFAQGVFAIGGKLPMNELRARFKESLGKKTIYRVTAARPSDLANIHEHGFVSNFYRSRTPEMIVANQDGYQSMEYNMSDLRGRLNVHAGGFASTKDSMLVSVSEYPEMAQYAGFVQLREEWPQMASEGYGLYLFPMELDEFNLIRYGKYLPKQIKGDGIWKSDKLSIPYNDIGVESFVEFRIPNTAIKQDNVKRIDIATIPKFEFVKT